MLLSTASSQVLGGGFLPTDISGLQLWLRPEVGVLNSAGDPASNLDKVDTWQDQSGNGNDAVQTTDANRPTFKTAQINGVAAVVYADSQTLDLTGMTVASGDYTIVIGCSPTAAANQRFMFDTATGRLAVVHRSNTGTAGYYDGAWRGTKVSTTGDQVLSWRLTDPTSGEVYRDAVALETGLTYGAKAVGGDTRLGSTTGGTANAFNGALAEIVLYDSALSAADLTRIHNYFGKYGTI